MNNYLLTINNKEVFEFYQKHSLNFEHMNMLFFNVLQTIITTSDYSFKEWNKIQLEGTTTIQSVTTFTTTLYNIHPAIKINRKFVMLLAPILSPNVLLPVLYFLSHQLFFFVHNKLSHHLSTKIV